MSMGLSTCGKAHMKNPNDDAFGMLMHFESV